MDKAIGKIVKSNSHVDYVCQVYGRGEIDLPPQPADYPFGAFVALAPEQAGDRLVGVIYHTELLNPDFGSLGPRLSPRVDLEVFMPDYLAETATLVGILALGSLGDGGAVQRVPPQAATINCPVYRLSEGEIAAFHRDRSGRFALRYVPFLLGQNSSLIMPLLIAIVDQLTLLFPDQERPLAVMRKNLAWKSLVQPVG